MEPQERSLTEWEMNALLEALEDEYKAVATWGQVLADGPRSPRHRGN